MKTFFNRNFRNGQPMTPQGQPIRVMQPAAPTFGGQAPAPTAAPAQPQRGVAAPLPQLQSPAPQRQLPGRAPVPVIPKGSGGPSCPVCRG